MNDAQIKYMVDRFLGWKLPADFHPDGGIHFDADGAKKLNPQNARYEPSGTNVFDAQQATAMVRYMVEGMPEALDVQAIRSKALRDALAAAAETDTLGRAESAIRWLLPEAERETA